MTAAAPPGCAGAARNHRVSPRRLTRETFDQHIFHLPPRGAIGRDAAVQTGLRFRRIRHGSIHVPDRGIQKTACYNFSMNKSVALIAVLFFISFSVFAVEPGEDKLGIYLVFNYEFQPSATGRGSFGFRFNMENQISVFQKHDSPGINTMHFSCVGCTDEEFKRAAAIYGLILLAGYGLANELAE